ncbi:response regulator [Pseudoduganella danionis]|uniref:response regulator n=1 Tax=Pseudoduganella danionis TaxID=1890295 RepID=UPI0035B374E2
MLADLHFLVVDDFSGMRAVIGNLLKDLGYGKVTEAADGREALARLNHNDAVPPINFIITDLNMPQMDGLELLKTVRATREFRKMPVLIVTAEGKRDNILSVAQAGADGYIVKPFTSATLKDKIEKIVQKRSVPA